MSFGVSLESTAWAGSADVDDDVGTCAVEVPELGSDRARRDRGGAVVEGRPLDGAQDHRLADINAVALQLLGEQADQLVLGGVGDREAHGVPLNGSRVRLGVEVAEATVNHQDG